MRPQRKREGGQALLWVAILLPLFLVLVGLVFDGGLLWQQYMRARWAISAAGVAAASEIEPDVLARTGQLVLKQPDALHTAARYARRNDPELRVTSVTIVTRQGRQYIRTRGWTQAETVFLQIFGVSGFQINVEATERPAWGIDSENQ
jgi:Flp pilus assembly protein TadG